MLHHVVYQEGNQLPRESSRTENGFHKMIKHSRIYTRSTNPNKVHMQTDEDDRNLTLESSPKT